MAMTGRDEQLRELIAAEAADRFVAGDGRAGAEDLLTWFRSSPVHVAEYLGMAKLGADLADAVGHFDIPLDTLIADARADSNVVPMQARDLRGASAAPQRNLNWRSTLARAAVGLAIAAVFTAGIGVILTIQSAESAFRYATGHGEERTIRLSDGTFVHLNTDSAVTVKFARDARLVELERGEAYFEVAKAPKRPFRVRAGASEFEDIGTAFNVFREAAATVVTVAEGKVEVLKAGTAQSNAQTPPARIADLDAGQQATVSATGAITGRATPNLNEILAWMRQEIAFDRKPIGEVAAEFNRYGDVPIVVRDPRIANIAISGNFQARDESAFVAFLNNLPGVRADEEGGRIVVSAKSGK